MQRKSATKATTSEKKMPATQIIEQRDLRLVINLARNIEDLTKLREGIIRKISEGFKSGGKLEPGPLSWDQKNQRVRKLLRRRAWRVTL